MTKPKQLTTADLVVLAVLLSDPPMHGYDLVKKLDASDVEDWASVSIPQVYYSLRKMAKSGHIVPVGTRTPSLGPNRITYEPTADARAELVSALKRETWVHHRIPTPFTTWTALAIYSDAETINSQFEKRAHFLETEIKREKETLITLKAAKGPGIKSARVMISVAISQMQAEADSLNRLKDAILSDMIDTVSGPPRSI